MKRIRTLEIYRYFYRFSIEKLNDFINDRVFTVMFLQYLQTTQLGRLHKKQLYIKTINNYYRAVENMINISTLRNEMIEAAGNAGVF